MSFYVLVVFSITLTGTRTTEQVKYSFFFLFSFFRPHVCLRRAKTEVHVRLTTNITHLNATVRTVSSENIVKVNKCHAQGAKKKIYIYI